MGLDYAFYRVDRIQSTIIIGLGLHCSHVGEKTCFTTLPGYQIMRRSNCPLSLRYFRMSKSALLTCLVLFSVLGVASGQTGEPNPLPPEQYDNPPALLPLWGTGVSPGMIAQEGPFTSRQVNVDGNGQNIMGDAANECSIAVDPTNHNRIVIGWRQFNSVTSNFRQGGYGYTTDAGMTWTFPGVLENNIFRSDPVLGCDDTGRFFYLSLLQSLFDNMWRSLDGGHTFTNLGPATGGDKQWFTIDNTNSTGHGFQYQSWDTSNNYGAQFSRSTDGGVTWITLMWIRTASFS